MKAYDQKRCVVRTPARTKDFGIGYSLIIVEFQRVMIYNNLRLGTVDYLYFPSIQ
jgi:hypothetical protein